MGSYKNDIDSQILWQDHDKMNVTKIDMMKDFKGLRKMVKILYKILRLNFTNLY